MFLALLILCDDAQTSLATNGVGLLCYDKSLLVEEWVIGTTPPPIQKIAVAPFAMASDTKDASRTVHDGDRLAN